MSFQLNELWYDVWIHSGDKVYLGPYFIILPLFDWIEQEITLLLQSRRLPSVYKESIDVCALCTFAHTICANTNYIENRVYWEHVILLM